MAEFKKSKRHLILYLIGFLLTIGALVAWILLLLKTGETKVGDIVLLGLFFLVLFGGELLFIILYLVRPLILLSFNDEEVIVHLSKKRDVVYPFSNLSSFGKIRNNLVLVTKDGEMRIVRFLKDSYQTEAALKAGLNAFITNHPDRYFTKNLLKDEETTDK